MKPLLISELGKPQTLNPKPLNLKPQTLRLGRFAGLHTAARGVLRREGLFDCSRSLDDFFGVLGFRV